MNVNGLKQAVEHLGTVEAHPDTIPLHELSRVYDELRALAKYWDLKMVKLHDHAKVQRRAARIRP